NGIAWNECLQVPVSAVHHSESHWPCSSKTGVPDQLRGKFSGKHFPLTQKLSLVLGMPTFSPSVLHMSRPIFCYTINNTINCRRIQMIQSFNNSEPSIHH